MEVFVIKETPVETGVDIIHQKSNLINRDGRNQIARVKQIKVIHA